MLNKKLHYRLLGFGAVALAIAFWMQYRISILRENIQGINEHAIQIGPSHPEYEEVLHSAWPLMREQESLDLFAKVFLGLGAFVLILGMYLYYKKRNSNFYM